MVKEIQNMNNILEIFPVMRKVEPSKYAMIRKHFRVTNQQDLPNRQEADYHHFQNVKSGME